MEDSQKILNLFCVFWFLIHYSLLFHLIFSFLFSVFLLTVLMFFDFSKFFLLNEKRESLSSTFCRIRFFFFNLEEKRSIVQETFTNVDESHEAELIGICVEDSSRCFLVRKSYFHKRSFPLLHIDYYTDSPYFPKFSPIIAISFFFFFPTPPIYR